MPGGNGGDGDGDGDDPRIIWERIRPRQWRDFVGNSQCVERVKGWCERGGRGMLVISGPPGTGKSSLAALAVAGARRRPYVVDDKWDGGATELCALAKMTTSTTPLDGGPAWGLVVDDFGAGAPISCADLLAAAAVKTRGAREMCMVVTMRDASTSAALRKLAAQAALHVTLGAATANDTQAVLRRVCTHKTVRAKLSHSQCAHIHACCGGDLRQASLMGITECASSSSSLPNGGGQGVVTTRPDAPPPVRGGAHDAISNAAAWLGLPPPPGVEACSQTAAEAAAHADPSHCLSTLHSVGGDLLQRDSQRPGALEAWGAVCDDMCVADVLHRRGGGAEAAHLSARCAASRQHQLWGHLPRPIDAFTASRAPYSTIMTAARRTSVTAAVKARRALGAVVRDAWAYPMMDAVLSVPGTLATITRDKRLSKAHVEDIVKGFKLPGPVEKAARGAAADCPQRPTKGGGTAKRKRTPAN